MQAISRTRERGAGKLPVGARDQVARAAERGTQVRRGC